MAGDVSKMSHRLIAQFSQNLITPLKAPSLIQKAQDLPQGIRPRTNSTLRPIVRHKFILISTNKICLISESSGKSDIFMLSPDLLT